MESIDKEYIEHRAGMISFIFLSEVEKELEVLGLNHSDLATMIGTSKSYITQLFRGDKYVNVNILARIESALKIQFKITRHAKIQKETNSY